MIDQQAFHELLERYQAGEASAEEQQLVEQWYLHELATGKAAANISEQEYAAKGKRMYAAITGARSATAAAQGRKLPLYLRYAGIAAAVATIVFGVWFFEVAPWPRNNRDSSSRTAGRDLIDDIAPGRNGATITLATGEVIQLDSAKTGVIVGQELKYDDHTAVISSEARDLSLGRDDEALTASTATGQTYQFTLPDGTKVWLNSGSKLEFPASFSKGKERRVRLTGEGYFAVVHNAKQPFFVESKGQVVEDIGTEFNISAYPTDETIKTTLVAGLAAVNGKLLKPNQQATVTNTELTVANIDPEESIAWKSGYFLFTDQQLKDIMAQLARWYNIEVSYTGNIAETRFSARIDRNRNISQVLRMLERTKGVHFKIAGRRVIARE